MRFEIWTSITFICAFIALFHQGKFSNYNLLNYSEITKVYIKILPVDLVCKAGVIIEIISGHMAVRHQRKLTLFTHVAKEIMYLRNMEMCQCFFKVCKVNQPNSKIENREKLTFKRSLMIKTCGF